MESGIENLKPCQPIRLCFPTWAIFPTIGNSESKNPKTSSPPFALGQIKTRGRNVLHLGGLPETRRGCSACRLKPCLGLRKPEASKSLVRFERVAIGFKKSEPDRLVGGGSLHLVNEPEPTTFGYRCDAITTGKEKRRDMIGMGLSGGGGNPIDRRYR